MYLHTHTPIIHIHPSRTHTLITHIPARAHTQHALTSSLYIVVDGGSGGVGAIKGGALREGTNPRGRSHKRSYT